jgi:hypothetical protein
MEVRRFMLLILSGFIVIVGLLVYRSKPNPTASAMLVSTMVVKLLTMATGSCVIVIFPFDNNEIVSCPIGGRRYRSAVPTQASGSHCLRLAPHFYFDHICDNYRNNPPRS